MDTHNVPYGVKDLGVKIVVGITCCLAMLGSLFVILSYLFSCLGACVFPRRDRYL